MTINAGLSIFAVILAFIMILFTGVKLITSKNITRENKFMGALFITVFFAMGMLLLKEYSENGLAALVELGGAILRR